MSAFKKLALSPSGLLIISALFCLGFADLSISTIEPWQQLKRIGIGFVTPRYDANILNADMLLSSLFNTLAFALQGVSLALVAGFLLSLLHKYFIVRSFCAFIRAIHELFWALLFMQLFGLSSLTGILAIAVPFAGIFAKVFSEQYEESDSLPKDSINPSFSRFLYTTLPLAWPNMCNYARYRLECGLRSSAILGFIGLPTLGFHLHTLFNEGLYSLSALILYIFIVLILSMRWWLQAKLLPIYLVAATIYLPPVAQFNLELLLRFFSEDIIPAPLRNTVNADSLKNTWQWLSMLSQTQILPGLFNTIVLSQIALVLSGAFALLLFPLISKHFFSKTGMGVGHSILVTLRSTPEYLLAFIGLLLLGPSMLPAALALSLHTGAIIAHLIGSASNQIQLRPDASRGLNRYVYEILPRIYRQLLNFLLYRWEVIMRESAILGILGITTLGFYIDSAFEEFRFDRAVLLILVSALLNIAVDQLSRVLRRA